MPATGSKSRHPAAADLGSRALNPYTDHTHLTCAELTTTLAEPGILRDIADNIVARFGLSLGPQ